MCFDPRAPASAAAFASPTCTDFGFSAVLADRVCPSPRAEGGRFAICTGRTRACALTCLFSWHRQYVMAGGLLFRTGEYGAGFGRADKISELSAVWQRSCGARLPNVAKLSTRLSRLVEITAHAAQLWNGSAIGEAARCAERLRSEDDAGSDRPYRRRQHWPSSPARRPRRRARAHACIARSGLCFSPPC